jgi:hypothetical protein
MKNTRNMVDDKPEISKPKKKAIGTVIIIHWLLLISSIIAMTWNMRVVIRAEEKIDIRSNRCDVFSLIRVIMILKRALKNINAINPKDPFIIFSIL